MTKLEIIDALKENTSALKLKNEELIDKLFEVQIAAEEQIKELCSYGLIEPESWNVSFMHGKYNDYIMYDGKIVDKYGGRYDGGDFNSWIPKVNYPALIKFVQNADAIIKGMQEELNKKQEELNKKIDNLNKK